MRRDINNPFHIKEYTFNEFDSLLKNYFSHIEYFVVLEYRVEDGMKADCINMIAVCTKV